MARKNILAGVMGDAKKALLTDEASGVESPSPAEGHLRHKGALGAVTRTIDALAAKAAAASEIEKRLVEGEVIVELDPSIVEASFISDRVRQDDDEFYALLEAIRARGQDSPILVRPHPEKAGMYQIAFGHRRLRVAAQLGRPVRAVVKVLSDRDHVVAQGQENAARADLSFIERALFARSMEVRGFDRETIMAALNADKTTVSKMLSLSARIPPTVLDTLRNAHGVGRDRWHELAARMDDLSFRSAAEQLVNEDRYVSADGDGRFQLLEKSAAPVATKAASTAPVVRNWHPNGGPKAKIRTDSRGFSLTLRADNARAFGDFLEQNLERLYQEFESASHLNSNGD
ncbi:MAG: plasmid partitioning protein RepB [Phyllobacteriaceae bacterium]|nr:plasmid partitioning protein RepB [Phyllobacteriaceae bacterium]